MKKFLATLISVLLCTVTCSFAQNETLQTDVTQFAYDQVDKLNQILELNDLQLFCADSILTTNILGMDRELKRLKESGVESMLIYQQIKDDWNEKTDNAFKAILDEKQWKKYLRSGVQREMRAREKRKLERQNAERAIKELQEKQ